MFENTNNTKQKGNVGIGVAIAYYTKMGYTVSVPLNDSQEYDLLVDDGQIRRVQVKTTSYKAKSGNYSVDMRATGGNQSFHTAKKFKAVAVDWIFILAESGETWNVPTDTLREELSTITLGKNCEDFKV